MTHVKTVILAGGQGTRFWPISRMTRPKQFLSISATGESLIQATARRVEPLGGKDALLIVTNVLHRPLIAQHVPHAQILCEPVGRNTAASIGLAALHVRREDADAVMVCLPADHAVRDDAKLLATLQEAVKIAGSEDALITIGITPTSPHTGYGYIKRGTRINKSNAYRVSRFFEKPNLERATKYVESGDFYWNSGMFAWRASVLLDAMKTHLPQLYEGLMKIDAAIGTKNEEKVMREVFEPLESTSIDFGVLEHAKNCIVVTAEPFGWNDVGSWDAWAEHFSTDKDGNLLHGDVLPIESKNCVIYSQEKLTAILGVDDLVVIDSGDALLICPRARVQDVRKVVDELKKTGRNKLI